VTRIETKKIIQNIGREAGIRQIEKLKRIWELNANIDLKKRTWKSCAGVIWFRP